MYIFQLQISFAVYLRVCLHMSAFNVYYEATVLVNIISSGFTSVKWYFNCPEFQFMFMKFGGLIQKDLVSSWLQNMHNM